MCFKYIVVFFIYTAVAYQSVCLSASKSEWEREKERERVCVCVWVVALFKKKKKSWSFPKDFHLQMFFKIFLILFHICIASAYLSLCLLSVSKTQRERQRESVCECVCACMHNCFVSKTSIWSFSKKIITSKCCRIGDNCAQWPGLLGRGYLVIDTTIYLFNTEKEGYLCQLVKAVTLS